MYGSKLAKTSFNLVSRKILAGEEETGFSSAACPGFGKASETKSRHYHLHLLVLCKANSAFPPSQRLHKKHKLPCEEAAKKKPVTSIAPMAIIFHCFTFVGFFFLSGSLISWRLGYRWLKENMVTSLSGHNTCLVGYVWLGGSWTVQARICLFCFCICRSIFWIFCIPDLRFLVQNIHWYRLSEAF